VSKPKQTNKIVATRAINHQFNTTTNTLLNVTKLQEPLLLLPHTYTEEEEEEEEEEEAKNKKET
jgi:hypothetical protein